MYNDIVNNYTNYIEKREIEEQNKRDKIIRDLNNKNDKDKKEYEKKLSEDKFRENLKKIKDQLGG